MYCHLGLHYIGQKWKRGSFFMKCHNSEQYSTYTRPTFLGRMRTASEHVLYNIFRQDTQLYDQEIYVSLRNVSK